MIERRKYPRVDFKYNVTIISDLGNYLEIPAHAGNISEGSMLIRTNRELLCGNSITVMFNQPGTKDVSFRISGEITRVTFEENFFETGMRFFALDEKQKYLLQQYVKAHS